VSRSSTCSIRLRDSQRNRCRGVFAAMGAAARSLCGVRAFAPTSWLRERVIAAVVCTNGGRRAMCGGASRAAAHPNVPSPSKWGGNRSGRDENQQLGSVASGMGAAGIVTSSDGESSKSKYLERVSVLVASRQMQPITLIFGLGIRNRASIKREDGRVVADRMATRNAAFENADTAMNGTRKPS